MLYLGASPTEILWKGTKAPVFNRKQLCALLIPLMLEQILASLMGMADTMMVSNVGSHAIAAVSLVDSLNIVMINLFSAMATGGSIICSQYIGRDDLRQANETARQLLLSITAISLVIGAVCLTLRRPLLSLIFGRVEDTVMENAEVYMLVTALSFPFLAMYNAGAALFPPAHDGIDPVQYHQYHRQRHPDFRPQDGRAGCSHPNALGPRILRGGDPV